MRSFIEKSVLVVGGSSGIGLAAARRFVAEGARVMIASRNRDRLAAALEPPGFGATASVIDMTDDAAVEIFCREHPTWDHVVVSAAETPMGAAKTLPMAAAYAAMNSKFWGA